MKKDGQLESVYSQAKWELSKSDKYVIRVVWNRYRKLYKQQQQGKLQRGEYATRRRNYLNLVYDIMGIFSIREPWMGVEDREFCEHCNGTGIEKK